MIAYATIRKTIGEDHEYMLPSEIDLVPESLAIQLARKAERIAEWHRANPIQRIAKVRIEEIKD